MKLVIYLIVIGFVVIGCKEKSNELDLENKSETAEYTIIINEANSFDSLHLLSNKIELLYGTKSKYEASAILVGAFQSAKLAWYFAEDLIKDTLISDYLLSHNKIPVEANFNKFIFVGGYLNRPSLFEFDFRTKKAKMVWSQWGRKIIKLFPRQLNNHYFFTTGLTMGRSGGFPFITDSRLYQYNKADDMVNRINKFGNGLQLSAGWKNSDTLKTSFVVMDSLKSSFFMDREILYNLAGKAVDTVETIYDILKDGFPKKTKPKIAFNSPDGKYHVQSRQEVGDNIIAIFKNKTKYLNTIDTTKLAISKIVWSEGQKYSVICTRESFLERRESENCIYIFNLEKNELIAEIETELLKDVIFYGDYLLFDDLSRDKQIIRIYDCEKSELFNTIEISKDCGIYSIPIKMSTEKIENLF